MLTLKGSLVGLAVFAVLSVFYLAYLIFSVVHNFRPAGGQAGINVFSIIAMEIRNPIYWVALIVVCSFTSMVLRSRAH